MSSSVDSSFISLVALNSTSVTTNAATQGLPVPLCQSAIDTERETSLSIVSSAASSNSITTFTSISTVSGVSGAISGVTSAIESPSNTLAIPSSTPLAVSTTVPVCASPSAPSIPESSLSSIQVSTRPPVSTSAALSSKPVTSAEFSTEVSKGISITTPGKVVSPPSSAPLPVSTGPARDPETTVVASSVLPSSDTLAVSTTVPIRDSPSITSVPQSVPISVSTSIASNASAVTSVKASTRSVASPRPPAVTQSVTLVTSVKATPTTRVRSSTSVAVSTRKAISSAPSSVVRSSVHLSVTDNRVLAGNPTDTKQSPSTTTDQGLSHTMAGTSAASQDSKSSSAVARPTDKNPVTHASSSAPTSSTKPASTPQPAPPHSSAGNTAPSSPSKPAASSAGSQAPTSRATEVASHTPSSGATGKPPASSPSAGSKSNSVIRATSPAVTPVSADHSLSTPTAVKSNVPSSARVSPAASRAPIAVASSPAAAHPSQSVGFSPTTHPSQIVPSPAVPSPAKGKTVPSLTHVTQGSSATQSDAPSQGAASPTAVSSDARVPASSTSTFSSFRGQANAQTPSVSTVTQFPETTLSTPVFMSVTNAKGQVSLSEPPFFTSITVATSDGQLVSITHVIANPTGIWGVNDNAAATTGFFSNTGAVAGVFLVVGVVVAILIALGVWLCRKKHRRQRIRHSISRPLPFPENPFEDPRETPSPTQMRFVPDSPTRNLIGAGTGVTPVRPRNLLDDEIEDGPNPEMIYSSPRYDRPSPQPTEQAHHDVGGGLAGVGAGTRSSGKPAYNGPFSDYHSRATHRQQPSLQGPFGLAITTEQTRIAEPPSPAPAMTTHQRRPPSAQSSPSIYPASLPPVATEEAEHGHEIAYTATAAPPPPPRLRPVEAAPGPLTPAHSSGSAEEPSPLPEKPPILPPRNPLRTSQHEASKLLVRTELPAFHQLGFNSFNYEPLTPPGSSSSAHSHTNSDGSGRKLGVNPFGDGNGEGIAQPGGNINANGAGPKENFYTRRKLFETRIKPVNSVEWRK